MGLTDNIFLINLKNKPERLESALSEIKKITDIKPKILPAFNISNIGLKIPFNIKHNNYSFGCTLSHWSVIKTSIMLGYDEAIIFEDDIHIPDDFDFQKHLDNAPDDWDMLFFGWHVWKQPHSRSVWKEYDMKTNWGVCKNACTTHFYMVRNLNKIDDLYSESGHKLQIDGVYNSWWNNDKLNCYHLLKGMATQKGMMGENKHINIFKSTLGN